VFEGGSRTQYQDTGRRRSGETLEHSGFHLTALSIATGLLSPSLSLTPPAVQRLGMDSRDFLARQHLVRSQIPAPRRLLK
jgi:hypothetical protein